MDQLGLEKAKALYNVFAVRFNPNHDSDGKFASSAGGSAGGGSGSAGGSRKARWSSKVDQMQSEFNDLPNNKKALTLFRSGYLSREDATAHMKDGTIGQYGDQYFQLLRENGDSEPTGAVRDDNKNRAKELVESGKYDDYIPARKALIKQDTGFSDDQVEKTYDEMYTWFSKAWTSADTATLDAYVEAAPTYTGTIHRGMHFNTAAEVDAFMQNAKVGDRIGMLRNASWTSDEETARLFAHTANDNVSSIMITCLKNRTSAPVSELSTHGEDEVLSSSKAQWTVLRSESVTRPNGSKKVFLYVIEAEVDND